MKRPIFTLLLALFWAPPPPLTLNTVFYSKSVPQWFEKKWMVVALWLFWATGVTEIVYRRLINLCRSLEPGNVLPSTITTRWKVGVKKGHSLLLKGLFRIIEGGRGGIILHHSFCSYFFFGSVCTHSRCWHSFSTSSPHSCPVAFSFTLSSVYTCIHSLSSLLLFPF